jgi:hypothetical protein
MEDTRLQTPVPAPPAKPIDSLALWDSEALELQASGLATIRIDQNERLLIPFTTSVVRANLHYLNFADSTGLQVSGF